MINVTIVGGGTIGYRTLQACSMQEDIRIVGITKRNFEDADGVYLSNAYPGKVFPVESLEEKLKETDIVVDCTDKASHILMPTYKKFDKLKVIIQGGEKNELADLLFNSYFNFDRARNAKVVKINSCNDTNFMRIYYAFNDLDKESYLSHIDWCLCRRAADPKQSKKGPINGGDMGTDTHHAADVRLSLPHLQVYSDAFKVSMTEMHMQDIVFKFTKEVTLDEVIERLKKIPRILLLEKRNYKTTSEVRELGRKLGLWPGRFGDIYETIVWQDEISVNTIVPFRDMPERKLYRVSIPAAIHQEAIVIPEIIDAIRALGSDIDAETSLKMTDLSLGIKRINELWR